jgi:DNA-binding phage protein
VADIQKMIQDCEQQDQKEAPYIRFNDLEAVGKNIRAFKDSLLHTVTENGGIKHLSELTHIPQPSLSRFFNSASMPHRSTLLKIAKALKLDAVKIATEWAR